MSSCAQAGLDTSNTQHLHGNYVEVYMIYVYLCLFLAYLTEFNGF